MDDLTTLIRGGKHLMLQCWPTTIKHGISGPSLIIALLFENCLSWIKL